MIAAAVNALGTPEQLAAERLAARTVNSLVVRLMKRVLGASFLASARRHYSSIKGPDAENVARLEQAVDEYTMAAAFQRQLLNPFDPTVVMQVAPPHVWYGLRVSGSRIGYDNPDTIYRFMPVNASSVYRITGKFVGEPPAELTLSVLTGSKGTTASVLRGGDLATSADGSFVITVSNDAPTDRNSNHLQIPNDSTLIAVRDTLSDWCSQVPVRLSILRISGPPNSLFSQVGGFVLPRIGAAVTGSPALAQLVSSIPPLPAIPKCLAALQAAAVMAMGIQMEANYMSVATTDPDTGQRRQTNQLGAPTTNAGFLATARQSSGYFQLRDDEALVVTIDPASAHVFVLPVTDDWSISQNFWDTPSSLNMSQSVPNSDGTFTLVVSPTDPGVANWVATGGLHQGTICLRFQGLDPAASEEPSVSTQVVSLDQLPNVLPETTAYVNGEQRVQQLVTRKAGYNKRFAPYPQP